MIAFLLFCVFAGLVIGAWTFVAWAVFRVTGSTFGLLMWRRERSRRIKAEREYYALPKILGGSGN